MRLEKEINRPSGRRNTGQRCAQQLGVILRTLCGRLQTARGCLYDINTISNQPEKSLSSSSSGSSSLGSVSSSSPFLLAFFSSPRDTFLGPFFAAGLAPAVAKRSACQHETVRRDRQGSSDAHLIMDTNPLRLIPCPTSRSSLQDMTSVYVCVPSVPFFLVAPLVPPFALFLAPAFGLARGLLADLLADFLTEALLPPPPPPVLF